MQQTSPSTLSTIDSVVSEKSTSYSSHASPKLSSHTPQNNIVLKGSNIGYLNASNRPPGGSTSLSPNTPRSSKFGAGHHVISSYNSGGERKNIIPGQVGSSSNNHDSIGVTSFNIGKHTKPTLNSQDSLVAKMVAAHTQAISSESQADKNMKSSVYTSSPKSVRRATSTKTSGLKSESDSYRSNKTVQKPGDHITVNQSLDAKTLEILQIGLDRSNPEHTSDDGELSVKPISIVAPDIYLYGIISDSRDDQNILTQLGLQFQNEYEVALQKTLLPLDSERKLETKKRRDQDALWNKNGQQSTIRPNEHTTYLEEREKMDEIYLKRRKDALDMVRNRFELKLSFSDQSRMNVSALAKRLKGQTWLELLSSFQKVSIPVITMLSKKI